MIDPTADGFGKYNGSEAECRPFACWRASDDDDPRSWPQRLEEAFAEKLDVSYAIAQLQERLAYMAMYAADGKLPETRLSALLTVVMDAHAAIHLGGVPVC